VLATWDIRSGNQLVVDDEMSFLAKHVKCVYNQHSPFCVYTPTLRHFYKEEVLFVWWVFSSVKRCMSFNFQTFLKRVLCWVKPPATSLVPGTLADLTRGKLELLAENALLRQQLIILRRQVKRPTYRKTDRLLLVLLARMARTWKQALFLVQPETLLRWHRELFRLFWKRKTKACARKSKLLPETICLIKEMAAKNRLWGAERIRGELLKLDIRVSKRTIQKYMGPIRRKRPNGQSWKTFLRNHAAGVWACDFLQVTDLFFRPLFAFFIIELQSRQVIHVNVTRSPTDPWVAQQLREATPYGQTPKYLIRDNDRKFGPNFARVATTSGIKVLRTPYRTPRANAVCERFLGSVRRECLDHFLIFHEKQLSRLLKAYAVYFNQARPHQGIGQRIPTPLLPIAPLPNESSKVMNTPVLGGLHHDYRKAA
jgi:transposase InsO family protein